MCEPRGNFKSLGRIFKKGGPKTEGRLYQLKRRKREIKSGQVGGAFRKGSPPHDKGEGSARSAPPSPPRNTTPPDLAKLGVFVFFRPYRLTLSIEKG